MFCTVCAAMNPLTSGRCAACGAGLKEDASAGTVPAVGAARRSVRPRRLSRGLRPTLVLVLPLALLLAGGGFWQADRSARAAAYARAEAALAAQDYVGAIEGFGAAGSYRDASARQDAAEAALAPYEAAYVEAVAALAAGDDAAAIRLLVTVVRDLPTFRDAAPLLAEARLRREAALLRAAEAAEDRGDWLAVERALAELTALNPDDPAPRDRLALVRHDHAPLVYSQDGAIYLIGPDGSDGRLLYDALPAHWPVWSPDRSRIAFLSPDRDGTSNLASLYVWSVVEPTTPARLLATELRPYSAPVWSPDGTRLAYVSEAAVEPSGSGDDPQPRTVRVVEVATAQEIDLTGGQLPNAASPAWSPDGTRLAVVSRRDDGIPGAGLLASGEVYVIAPATGQIDNVGQGRVSGPWRLAWSPTTEAIIVATRSPGMSYDADRSSLYLIDPRTRQIEDLNPRGEKVSMPVWSPDGRRYAYVVNDTTIRVRGLDGADTWTTLERPVNGALTWSPGGEALFALGATSGPSYRIPLGEHLGQEQPLTLDLDPDTRQAGAPQWSPLNPAASPAPVTAGGTAHDPAAGAGGVAGVVGEAPGGAR